LKSQVVYQNQIKQSFMLQQLIGRNIALAPLAGTWPACPAVPVGQIVEARTWSHHECGLKSTLL
jgi:hypothetical protein